jgi:aminoglycoside 2'-N-acetyltransferase I
MGTKVQVAHTSALDAAVLGRARRLLVEVFEGDWTEDDWEHSLGGVHVLAYDGGELVGHGAVVQRRLVHADRALRTGYVEGVGVRADLRGNGVGAAIMSELERVIRAAYAIGALSSSEEALEFYARRGWRNWEGATFALTPAGIQRTADDDGGVYVLPATAHFDLTGDLVCDWRDGELW